MTLRIENYADGRKTVIRLSGRLQSTHLDELNTQIESAQSRIALDLSGVVLVDVEVVRFLNGCEESAGKTPVIQKSEHWQANNTIGGEKVRGPSLQRPQPVRRPLHPRSHAQSHRPGDHPRRSRCLHGQERPDHARAVFLRGRALTAHRIG